MMASDRSVGLAGRLQGAGVTRRCGRAAVPNKQPSRERRCDEHADTGRAEHSRGLHDEEQGLVGAVDGQGGDRRGSDEDMLPAEYR